MLQHVKNDALVDTTVSEIIRLARVYHVNYKTGQMLTARYNIIQIKQLIELLEKLT